VQAEILSVGTELLLGEIVDTNAQYISSRFRELGIDIYRRSTVGDNPARLIAAFKEAMGRADIVLATGGLGPTDDDVTAQCLAAACGRKLVFSEEAWRSIKEWLEKRGRQATERNKKEAYIIEGGMFLPNTEGTAPGQAITIAGKLAAILPGPPREMMPMFEEKLVPLIRKTFPDLVPLGTVNLKLVGIPEARVNELVKDLMGSANPSLAPYVGTGEVRLRIAARGCTEQETKEMLTDMEKKVRQRLGQYIYGKDDETLEGVVGRLLRRRGLKLAVAESITGGLICQRLTQVPGSSLYFKMGMVAYSPKVKASCLGVSYEDVNRDESVNEEVAKSMADGVRRLAGTDIGLSTTGFAGPAGGTEKEPVGTVYTALSYKDEFVVDRQVYPGSRATVKARAAQGALCILFKFLKGRS